MESGEALVELVATSGLKDLNLLYRLVRLLDTAEGMEQDPARLAFLFELDRLVARLRRSAEGLLVLVGAPVPLGRPGAGAMGWLDVARAAAAESLDFRRVQVAAVPAGALARGAADDLVHLLAELIDNALGMSANGAQITVGARLVQDGVVVIVEDRGIGLSPDQVAALNARLAAAPVLDVQATCQRGLHMVACLARRLGAFVQLRQRPGGGTTALVIVPQRLVIDAPVARPSPFYAAAAGVAGDRWAHPPAASRSAGVGAFGLPQRTPAPGPWRPDRTSSGPPDPRRVLRDLGDFDAGLLRARRDLAGWPPSQSTTSWEAR